LKWIRISQKFVDDFRCCLCFCCLLLMFWCGCCVGADNGTKYFRTRRETCQNWTRQS
jgi:hypothetical protein